MTTTSFIPSLRTALFSFILTAISLTTSGCYFDKEDELYGDLACKTGTISYAADVVPVLEANCYSCHNTANAPISGDNIKLDGYTNLTNYLQTNQTTFIGSIEHNGDGDPMPENGAKMSNCNIKILTDWISQGKLNN